MIFNNIIDILQYIICYMYIKHKYIKFSFEHENDNIIILMDFISIISKKSYKIDEIKKKYKI